jgi:hypothetical protein
MPLDTWCKAGDLICSLLQAGYLFLFTPIVTLENKNSIYFFFAVTVS